MKTAGINSTMDDYHVIVRIVEDDYGCEDREEGAPDMAMCLIASMDGTKLDWYRIPESVLAEHHLDEGDQIVTSLLEEIKA